MSSDFSRRATARLTRDLVCDSDTADLTMNGQTHPVTLAVDGPTAPASRSPFGTTIRGISATGTPARKAWGLGRNKAIEAGGVMVGDQIALQIDAELVAK